MSKPRPPIVDFGTLAAMDEFDKLRNRFTELVAQVQGGKMSHEFVALEGLSVIAGALQGSFDLDKIKNAWPVPQWRENTVEVPVDFLLPLAASWFTYQNAPEHVSLGKVFGVEGGSRPTHSTLATKDKRRRLSGLVLAEYFRSDAVGSPISVEKAWERVAEDEGVSEDTVRAAYKHYGTETLKKIPVTPQR